ncbi:hypothetical protein [Rugosimonospora africana]|uniref:Uncharacterized protein n=1 Tax=Rugosimonospora africana TaxID=556532 RepID=A0A8J3VUS6_9ACTN|nr:hypothetical protein [Rugosimonospora africana]GIH18973.1 hypothetical protein Raf01_71450 [Rugosimonospora africana]
MNAATPTKGDCMSQAPTLVSESSTQEQERRAPQARNAARFTSQANIVGQQQSRVVPSEDVGMSRQRPTPADAAVIAESDLEVLAVLVDLTATADNTQCRDHAWPSDLDPDGECEQCGLAYKDWSL